VESGALRGVVDRNDPLSEKADAVRHLSEGHARGKVSIEVAEEAEATATH